jgi:hypothetical protein
VLLEYLAVAAVFFGGLEALAAITPPCRGPECAIVDGWRIEVHVLLAGLTVAGFIVSLFVIAFRQRRWARARNTASHETSIFRSATVATAYGWAWAYLARH